MPDADIAAHLEAHAADECIDVTTVGRSTGRPHRVEIWFGLLDGVVYLISGNGEGADWYRNALAAGSATIHVGGRDVLAVASEVDDLELRRRIGDLMGAKYDWDGDPSIDLTRHSWCYEVPVLALTPR